MSYSSRKRQPSVQSPSRYSSMNSSNKNDIDSTLSRTNYFKDYGKYHQDSSLNFLNSGDFLYGSSKFDTSQNLGHRFSNDYDPKRSYGLPNSSANHSSNLSTTSTISVRGLSSTEIPKKYSFEVNSSTSRKPNFKPGDKVHVNFKDAKFLGETNGKYAVIYSNGTISYYDPENVQKALY